ncbi:hypothetical protein HZA87_00325 [Candidatus Uhrbacteria bacterium]|nr:hypothetical protein [Candidatus Uhrbacteria bacterium]
MYEKSAVEGIQGAVQLSWAQSRSARRKGVATLGSSFDIPMLATQGVVHESARPKSSSESHDSLPAGRQESGSHLVVSRLYVLRPKWV